MKDIDLLYLMKNCILPYEIIIRKLTQNDR
jgi:hypothetical protein